MGAAGANGGAPHTQVLVVTDGEQLAEQVCAWMSRQITHRMVERVTGFYAAVTALSNSQVDVVVMDAAVASPRDEWQLASLRNHCTDTAIIVLGPEPRRGALAGALHADLAVPDVAALPPLRELMTGPAVLDVRSPASRS